VTPTGQNDTGPSRLLWKDCPWEDIGHSVRGVKLFDDFANFPQLPTAGIANQYATFWDTGGTIQQGATDAFGRAVMTVDADDNQAAEIQTGGGTGNCANFIDPATGTAPHNIWFECRFELSALVGNCFFGLMEAFTPAGDHITDAGALADKGLVGFSTLEATPTILNFTYKKAGQTVQVPITTFHTMVADTAVTVGFHYLVGSPTAKKIMAFKNGLQQATGITKANIEAATFADNVPTALTAAIKNVTDITSATLHWWKFAMVEG
jgi:hypothetical protein